MRDWNELVQDPQSDPKAPRRDRLAQAVRSEIAEASSPRRRGLLMSARLPALAIFVATRFDQVPPGCERFISVDGTVPGASVVWDHHTTGEKINLDAMPQAIELAGVDGVGTTSADTDAVVSIAAVLLGGKARLPRGVLAILESACHVCDHLVPHPGHSEEDNRLGRGLHAALSRTLDPTAGIPDQSQAVRAASLDLAARIVDGLPLPFADHSDEPGRRAVEQLRTEGRTTIDDRVGVVDLRGMGPIDPADIYAAVDCRAAVFVENHAAGGLRYTVGVNPFAADAPSTLAEVMRELARLEFEHGAPALGPEPVAGAENWGGRATVFGSPWNYGSRLEPGEVAGVVRKLVVG